MIGLPLGDHRLAELNQSEIEQHHHRRDQGELHRGHAALVLAVASEQRHGQLPYGSLRKVAVVVIRFLPPFSVSSA